MRAVTMRSTLTETRDAAGRGNPEIEGALANRHRGETPGKRRRGGGRAMPARTANARWEGGLKDGKGNMRLGGGAFEGQYSFSSRFEEGTGTNPEELIAAAHAGCFSMALSNILSQAGHTPTSVETTATVHLDRVEGGFGITRIDLSTRGDVPGID